MFEDIRIPESELSEERVETMLAHPFFAGCTREQVSFFLAGLSLAASTCAAKAPLGILALFNEKEALETRGVLAIIYARDTVKVMPKLLRNATELAHGTANKLREWAFNITRTWTEDAGGAVQ